MAWTIAQMPSRATWFHQAIGPFVLCRNLGLWARSNPMFFGRRNLPSMSHSSSIERNISQEPQSAARTFVGGGRQRPVLRDNAGTKLANGRRAHLSHPGVPQVAADNQICRHDACVSRLILV